jgi:hypothetical protein
MKGSSKSKEHLYHDTETTVNRTLPRRGLNAVDSRLNAIFKCLKTAPVPPCCNRVAIKDEDVQLLVDMAGNPYMAGMSDFETVSVRH